MVHSVRGLSHSREDKHMNICMQLHMLTWTESDVTEQA